MKLLSYTLILFAGAIMAGCAAAPVDRSNVTAPQSQYDSILVDSKGDLLSINQLGEQLESADVVVIGEYHGHHGAHLLQALIQSTLYRKRPRQVLSMEQFALDDQAELNSYLSGQIGEEELIADTRAWSNYKASYRPLIEFSRLRNLPVVAANAPPDIVRCVGRTGEAFLEQLDVDQRRLLPDDPFVDTPDYRRKFFDRMDSGHGGNVDSADTEKRLENSYKAQLLRDNTMADRVIKALAGHPGHQVIHLTGTFHAEDRLGMVAVLEKQRPDLEVAVVSPVFWQSGDNLGSLLDANRGKGDFLYFLQPLPEGYKNSERQHASIMAQFRNAAEPACN